MNLTGYTYPNGVATQYSYNNLNRLVSMSATNAGTSISQYQYTLGFNGNRLSVNELSGRLVNYTYDVAGDRLSRASNLTGIPDATYTYDATTV